MEPDIIIAIDKTTRELRNISEVERGLACNCVCYDCGGVLEACKGEQRRYFRHHSNDRNCVGSWESQLHLLSKYIIEKNKTITLPVWRGDNLRLPSRKQEFTEVTVELAQGDLQPDCLCKYVDKKGEEKVLWVEILNTHAVDEAKAQKIKERGIACVEIDVSNLFPTREIDEEVLKDFLLNSNDSRQWINNPDGDREEQYYKDEATKLHKEDSIIKYIDEHSNNAEQINELTFVGFYFFTLGFSLSNKTYNYLREYIKFYRADTRINARKDSEKQFFISALQFLYSDLCQRGRLVSRKRTKEDTFVIVFNNRQFVAKEAFGFADDILRIRV